MCKAFISLRAKMAEVFEIKELNRRAFVADFSALIRKSWKNLQRGTVSERVQRKNAFCALVFKVNAVGDGRKFKNKG